jgi:hypothetical protein
MRYIIFNGTLGWLVWTDTAPNEKYLHKSGDIREWDRTNWKDHCVNSRRHAIQLIKKIDPKAKIISYRYRYPER